MNTKRLLALIIVGLALFIKAEAKKVNGLIFFENDTVEVTFIIPVKIFTQEINFESLQGKIRYIDHLGAKKNLRPDQAVEIRFTYNYENVRMLSRHNSLRLGNFFSMSPKIFLRLEIDGYLKLFHYYYTQSSPGIYNSSTGAMTGGYSYSVERYVLQKGEDELKRPKALSFRNDMIEYFKECPELVKKIENKDFRKDDLESIVRYYNSSCN